MSLHSLKRIQVIPVSLEEAWDFFSSPLNLDIITPPDMNFRVRSEFKKADRVFAGMMIQYTVSPLFKIPLRWTTEITEVQHHHHFIDEQRKGPFAYWHHEHFFEEVNEGVKMTDRVSWRVPGWIFGDLINMLVVQKRVEAIFEFRKLKMQELFGTISPAYPGR